MWSRLKKSFDNGMKKIQWFSSLLSERLRIEISLFKLAGKIEGLEKRKSEIMKSIGEKVFEMRQNPAADIYSQKEIRVSIKELEEVEKQIEEIKNQAEDISSLVAE